MTPATRTPALEIALGELEPDMRQVYENANCEICRAYLTDAERVESIEEKTLPHCSKCCDELKRQMSEFLSAMAEYGA